MLKGPINTKELKQLRLQAVLAEYQAIRSEMLQKFQHHLQIYSIIVTAITIILGWVITKNVYDALLVIPIFSIALSLRYIWEQNVIVIMGGYLKVLEEKIFPNLLSGDGTDDTPESRWINWEHYFQENFPKFPLYKPAIQILIIIVPIVPAIIFSILNLLPIVLNMPEIVKSHLHPLIHLVALITYIIMGIYVSIKLWKS
ncbi:MAG: hypothetical protein WC223_09365 [Bacteroidales bacterium]|jgi:hypothetical protein